MSNAVDAASFPRTCELLRGSDYGCDLSGSQVYVSVFGEPVFEHAVGTRVPGAPMTVDASVLWTCCSKSMILLPLARLLSAAGLSEDDAVAEVIPEFATAGKDKVKLSHLLTHTVGYQSFGLSWMDDVGAVGGDESRLMLLSQDEALAEICRDPIVGELGDAVRYTAIANWVVLAGVIERLAGRPYEEVTEDAAIKPLGMTRTTASLRPADLPAWEPTRTQLHNFDAEGGVTPGRSDEPPLVFQRWPGVGFRGPASEMARPMECLAGWRERELVSEPWRRGFTEPARFDLPDALYDGAELIWSLGLCADPVPFGLDLDRRVCGLTGKQSSFVFSDLDSGVTVSFLSSKYVPLLVDRRRKISLAKTVMAEVEAFL
jgi:CubicO group peptidase (beta-lactamase class C family)